MHPQCEQGHGGQEAERCGRRERLLRRAPCYAPDVTVTNQSDKDTQLEKIERARGARRVHARGGVRAGKRGRGGACGRVAAGLVAGGFTAALLRGR